MYNRYIPEEEYRDWTPVAPEPEQREEENSLPLSKLLHGGRAGYSELLKALHLKDIDSGDILLLLIMLYLLVEGDELELVIALGLVLIMGLGDEKD